MPCCSLGSMNRLIILLATAGVCSASAAQAQPTQDNVAWKGKISGSKGAADLWGMNDGDYGTKADIPHNGWFAIDLGEKKAGERIYFINRGIPFNKATISTSDDGVTWTDILQLCSSYDPKSPCIVNGHGNEIFIKPVTAQHFKMTCAAGDGQLQTSFYEFSLYGPNSSTKNLALGKPAFSALKKGVPTEAVTDGNFLTGLWLQFVDQWITVDMGTPTVVNRISVISNHDGISRQFSFFWSNNNETWTKLFDMTPGVGSRATRPRCSTGSRPDTSKGCSSTSPTRARPTSRRSTSMVPPGQALISRPSRATRPRP